MPNVKKIRGLNLPGTPWATSACCGRPLPRYSLDVLEYSNPALITVTVCVFQYSSQNKLQIYVQQHPPNYPLQLTNVLRFRIKISFHRLCIRIFHCPSKDGVLRWADPPSVESKLNRKEGLTMPALGSYCCTRNKTGDVHTT